MIDDKSNDARATRLVEDPRNGAVPNSGRVVAVHSKADHGVRKASRFEIELVTGFGVVGDAHYGSTVQHRSRKRTHPNQRNLRQVHLIHGELIDELLAHGLAVACGEMGENVTTSGLDLLSLSSGTTLSIGASAVLEITGLRNPCTQLEEIHPGLMEATLGRTFDGKFIRKAGVMAVVVVGGIIRAGDSILVAEPSSYESLLPA